MKPKTVYHGTSAAAAADILKRGVRMEESSKGYFGMGFYTTEKQALAKSNYADFAEEDDDPGVVLAFSVSPRARLLDLRTSKDWDRYMALRWRGLSVTQFLHRDDFHTIMQSLRIDGLYDDSFDGWVFYNPKVLKLIKSNPLLVLPPDFFPRISKQRDQLKAIRDDIHKKTGVWYDDLDEVATLLHKAEAAHRRKQIRVVKKANPIKKVKTMNRTKKNPDPHPLDPQYLGAFKSPAEVPKTNRDGDTVVVWREEYNRWEAWVYDSMDKAWAYGSQGSKAEMVRKAQAAVAYD